MNRNTIIPIFFACDNQYTKYTMVAMKSMIENASKEYTYHMHILHTDVSAAMQERVKELENANTRIYFDDVTERLAKLDGELPVRDYYSHTTYYRLFIPDMYPQYDKAIYIDSDTIVKGDISRLYDFDLGDNYVGGVNDQVVVQDPIFGDYVEKVLGVERNNYFNAGLLLINCDQFRKNNVLDQFCKLLHMYNFVVAQDQDYLNVICHNKVLWLPQVWNTEVFGEIAPKEEDICILHYNLAAKPWHYKDCRMQQYFWKYAERSGVYPEILKELETYTDEQRAEDMASGANLLELAKQEIAKENNYLNLVQSGKLKSEDRIEVLDKIAMLEREGRFDEDVEEDPPSKELKPEDIDYLRKKWSSKIKTKLTYRVARSFMNNIIANKQLIIKDVIGIEHMNALDSGAVITCNHFNAFDSFAIQIAYEKSKRNCYTFPLSSNKETMKKFLHSMDAVLQHGDFMVVYPEQSMWWNYRKPKPLKKGAYTFAAQNHVPVLPCFITMQDSDILGDDGFYIQEYTIHIAPAIYPDPNKSRAVNIEEMRQKNYEVWKEIYEKTYGEPLVYECDDMPTIA